MYFVLQSTLIKGEQVMENQNERETEALRILATAKEMIARTKFTVVDRSTFYFLWGALVFVASISSYILEQRDPGRDIWLPWAILMPFGGIVSGILMGRKRSRSHVQTYAEHTYDGVWLSTGLAAAIIVFGNPILHYFPPRATYVLISILAGLAVYSSGHIMGLVTFKLGGLSWWCGAVIMMIFPDKYHPLIMASVVLPGYLLPGYLLRRSVRSQHAE
jgi:hypothetical protein